MPKQIAFDILARDRASKTFDQVGKSSAGLAGKFSKMGLGVAMAAGTVAVGGIAALSKAMIGGVQDAATYQDLQNKTRAVLKSTGNAAHTSVKDIQAHAGALESLSGVDEELIINSQNVLATFTQVSNGMGKGNDIFDQATKTALDMSSALGTDLQGATIQVGKALNDPIKGVTALQKVGVSFTGAQKDQIKAMVASGDTMGAQKVILGELSKEFGGAAKAAGQGFNGSMARVKDLIGDTFRTIGMKLLPTVTRLANWFANDGAKAVERFFGWFGGRLMPALRTAWQTILPGVHQAMAILTGGVGKGSVSWKQIGDVITQKVIPVVATVARVYLPMVAANIRITIEVVKRMWQNFQIMARIVTGSIRIVVGQFLSMVGIVINAAAKAFGWVPGIGPKLRGAAAQFNTFRNGVNAALAGTRSNKRVYVSAPGASKVIQQLADLKWRTQQIPRSVTIGVNNKLAQMPGFAGGVRNFGGGWAKVGEEGPEIVHLPKGADVFSNRESQAMVSTPRPLAMGAGAGSSQPLVVNFNLDGRMVQQVLLKVKRTNGGLELGLA